MNKHEYRFIFADTKKVERADKGISRQGDEDSYIRRPDICIDELVFIRINVLI